MHESSSLTGSRVLLAHSSWNHFVMILLITSSPESCHGRELCLRKTRTRAAEERKTFPMHEVERRHFTALSASLRTSSRRISIATPGVSCLWRSRVVIRYRVSDRASSRPSIILPGSGSGSSKASHFSIERDRKASQSQNIPLSLSARRIGCISSQHLLGFSHQLAPVKAVVKPQPSQRCIRVPHTRPNSSPPHRSPQLGHFARSH